MGRGRAKGKKQILTTGRDNTGSGEEVKVPVRRRGRPTKPLKNDIVEDDEVILIQTEEEEEVEDAKDSILTNSNKTENGKKRKRSSPVKENTNLVKDKNEKTNHADVIKPVGFRQIGSRRKNKPRRAAEVGVECR